MDMRFNSPVLKWSLIGAGYVIFVELSKLIGLYDVLVNFIYKNPRFEWLLLLGLVNGFVEGTAFLNLYFPGTVLIIIIFSIVYDSGYSQFLFITTVYIGVFCGVLFSNFLGKEFGHKFKETILVSDAKFYFKKYGYIWILIASWSPNWLSYTFFSIGFFYRKYFYNFLIGAMIFSALYYFIYSKFFGIFERETGIDSGNYHFFIGGILVFFGILLEVRMRLRRTKRGS